MTFQVTQMLHLRHRTQIQATFSIRSTLRIIWSLERPKVTSSVRDLTRGRTATYFLDFAACEGVLGLQMLMAGFLDQHSQLTYVMQEIKKIP